MQCRFASILCHFANVWLCYDLSSCKMAIRLIFFINTRPRNEHSLPASRLTVRATPAPGQVPALPPRLPEGIPAFPGACGGGMFTTGGRGNKLTEAIDHALWAWSTTYGSMERGLRVRRGCRPSLAGWWNSDEGCRVAGTRKNPPSRLMLPSCRCWAKTTHEETGHQPGRFAKRQQENAKWRVLSPPIWYHNRGIASLDPFRPEPGLRQRAIESCGCTKAVCSEREATPGFTTGLRFPESFWNVVPS